MNELRWEEEDLTRLADDFGVGVGVGGENRNKQKKNGASGREEEKGGMDK